LRTAAGSAGSANALLLLLLLLVLLIGSSSSISTVWLASEGGTTLRESVAARKPGGKPMPDASPTAELG
jgi:hypothetical protein